MVADYLTFLRELPKSFSQIGAMLPSSPHLGKLMVRPIRSSDHPLRILEVGPGTGPFTRQILRLMRPEDELVICEVNARFMRQLKTSFRKNKHYQDNRSRVHFFLGPIQEIANSPYAEEQFDVIVCSLPFLIFNPSTVEQIFSLFESLLKHGGSLTFFQYIGLRHLGTFCADRETKDRIRGVEKVISEWCQRAESSGRVVRKVSLFNLPPALSVECRLH